MQTIVTILEINFIVEWEFTITQHGFAGSGPSFSSPGEPPEPVEFDIEVVALYELRSKNSLDIPLWLKDLLAEHLYERDDVYSIVNEADQDGGEQED